MRQVSVLWLFSYDVIAAPGKGKRFVHRMAEGTYLAANTVGESEGSVPYLAANI
jgi:hypothetical protein